MVLAFFDAFVDVVLNLQFSVRFVPTEDSTHSVFERSLSQHNNILDVTP